MRHDGSMRRRLPVMIWASVWVIVVAVSATSVWLVIERAGARVTSQAAPQLPVGTVAATPRPDPSPATTATPGPAAVQGSWNGPGGRVTATCRSREIRLNAAVPADGFTVEIENRGPETLEVELHQSRGDREFKVRGVCRAGGPVFTVAEE